MKSEQAERTDIPTGFSSGDAFSLSMGKYVLRACAAKTDGQINAEKIRCPDKTGNFQRK